jgi:hypothetical protein
MKLKQVEKVGEIIMMLAIGWISYFLILKVIW